MKKIVTLLSLLAVGFLFFACGDDTEKETQSAWLEINCPFGAPLLTDDSFRRPLFVVEREGYAAGYSEEALVSLWACENLSSGDASGTAERKTYIKRDPDLPKDVMQPNDDDYTNSGYDRGHLVPFADRKYSQEIADTLFYWTNIAPQNPELNQRAWLDLENYVRELAAKCGAVRVVTGVLFLDDEPMAIGNNGVWVPSHIYKLIVRGKVALAVVFPNVLHYPGAIWSENPDIFWTVDELEDAADLNFMPRLGNQDASEMESTRWTLEELEDC